MWQGLVYRPMTKNDNSTSAPPLFNRPCIYQDLYYCATFRFTLHTAVRAYPHLPTRVASLPLQIFSNLGETHWTLLVNEVNRHVPEVSDHCCAVL